MNVKERYTIDIYRLSTGVHEYDFVLDAAFFQQFPDSLVKDASGDIHVTLDKRDSLIQATLDIDVKLPLVCDRSLREFDYPVHEKHEVLFKYGAEEQELDDDVYMITANTQQIHLDQFIYEWILLAVPMKKIHPELLEDEAQEEDESFIYQSDEGTEDEGENEHIDPRWEQLRKLRNKE